MLRKLLFILGSFTCITLYSKAQSIALLQEGKPTSIRGLSVVNNHIAWASGSKGYVAITKNGGKTWDWQQLKSYEQVDFRDIEAFSAKEAIIMSSGTPALILKTADGGNTWQLKYRSDDKAYFLDAMDFANHKHGMVLGDPIDNRFILLETNDAGETWHEFANRPKAYPGEAAFAASGTCLRTDRKDIKIVTGGRTSRYLNIDFKSGEVKIENALPIAHGTDSKGAFSVSVDGAVIVGGNYSKDKNRDSVSCYFNFDLKNNYRLSTNGPSGYQSCVEHIQSEEYLSTGTSGTNITTNGGKTWRQIDTRSFNVCAKSKHGKWVLLAGDKGKIAVLKL